MTDRTPSDEDALKFGFLRRRSSTTPPIGLNDPYISKSDGPTAGPAIDADEYNMNHLRRGHAVIFNHTHFKDGQSPRAGADQDVKALQVALSALEFNIFVYNNLTKKEVFEKLNEVARLDHSDSDCLVIVVMTHGDTKELCAYDQPYNVASLWESFKGEKSPTLRAKPKLFFIQACRGSAVDDGVRITPQRVRTHTDGSSTSAFYVIPNYADFLIANATFDGHYAWRSGETGSWFIQALCRELSTNDGKTEICTILTRVNRRVAISQSSYVPLKPEMHMKKQMPNFLSTLTRQLYLKHKK